MKESLLESWNITYGHALLRLLTGSAAVHLQPTDTLPSSVVFGLHGLQSACEKALMFPNITLVEEDADRVSLELNRHINDIERNGFVLHAALWLPLLTSERASRPELRLSVRRAEEPEPFTLPVQKASANIADPTHFTWWDSIQKQSIDAFRQVLESGATERELHRSLEVNPILLVQGMGSGHGRWLYSRKKLSLQYEIDFLIAEQNSMGFTWTAVELEIADDPFTARGEPNARLHHAIEQVRSWRIWLDSNAAHAQKPRSQNGLGLRQITSRCQATIYMGRRRHYTDQANALRRHIKFEDHVAIRSYDGLLDDAAQRLRALGDADG